MMSGGMIDIGDILAGSAEREEAPAVSVIGEVEVLREAFRLRAAAGARRLPPGTIVRQPRALAVYLESGNRLAIVMGYLDAPIVNHNKGHFYIEDAIIGVRSESGGEVMCVTADSRHFEAVPEEELR